MLFSVIIPTYNRIELLKEALDSVWAQELDDYEVIVIDDGSSDGTREFLESQGERIRTIYLKNGGPGAARNRGIEQAQGDFVAFLDSDDLWFSWTTRVYREVLEASGADLLFGKPQPFRSATELEVLDAPEKPTKWLAFDDYFAAGDEWRWWGASSFVVRRSRLDGVRFVETSINGEDADWVLKLGDGVPLVQIPGCPTFAYREHDGSVMKDATKTLAGAWNLVKSELEYVYPGSKARRKERLRILGRHLRPVILDALRNGPRCDGRKLLLATLKWHVEERRFRFLAASILHSLKP